MQKIVPVLVCAIGLFSCKQKQASVSDKPAAVTSPATASPAATPATTHVSYADVKPHVCTSSCKNGNHDYLHGEIGHTCSSDCGKPHVCTSQCKNGAHVYAHGEVGHYCLCSPKS